MNISLCTLFEKNYHYGVAALTNSLIAAGYQGDLWVGYRGELPAWITGAPSFDAGTGRFEVAPGLTLRMMFLDTPVHFTYYKPTFIRDLLEKHAPEAAVMAYIDPDIVVKCDWPSFCGWFTDDGISLIEDVNWCFPARHPKRLQWNRFFEPHGVVPKRALERYYNAGFIAVPRAHLDFLDLWRRLCDLVLAHNAGAEKLKIGGGADLFHSTDQDALNFALTVYDAPLNTAGPEAMDFAPGGYYLSHAIGSVKPWHGKHIQQALRGQPPRLAAKAYFQFANAPIKVWDDGDLARRRLELRIAAAIGRVYRSA
ncbi:hypothetical protein [Variovorax sp. YR216]|uniref:hypothetical protein n=1 Tax=Variovorax sp. YR216 TaxID=1882828 RepID=UPI0008998D98|nr:hypothetical protein [Variovorax sp. YR216]SEA98542.1 hypothetical protein SAMN05444680_10523 [Variovorax sp. YR216]